MKEFLFMVFLLGFFKVQAADIIEINADKIFSVETNIKKNSVINSSDNKLFSVSVRSESANPIFLSDYDKIIIRNFELSTGNKVDLELYQSVSAINERTKWIKVEQGKFIEVEGPYVVAYSGKISGEPGSNVYFNYTNGKIFGSVSNEVGERFTISPQNNQQNANQINVTHIIKKENENQEEKSENPFVCLTKDYSGDLSEASDRANNFGKDGILAQSKVLQVNLLCEGSYDYFTLMGSNYDYCAAYMASVINQSSKIYLDNINVHLVISKVVIRTDEASCPYVSDADLSDKLMTMPSVWKYTDLDRSLVVLFADLMDQPSGTIVAGISMGGTPYQGSLCDVDQGYCALGIRGGYKYPTMNYTWDVNVATHEIGHNFSSPHTHNCYYRPNMIDTCVTRNQPFQVWDACVSTGNAIPRPGTIMSYCHTTNATRSVELVFHDRNKPLMRKAAEVSSCVAEAPGSFLSLLHPLGDSSYQAGKTMQIRWTSKNVKTISIYYSLDSGLTWIPINELVTAADSIYNWTTPIVTSYKCLVAIKSVADNSIYDKSLTTFVIAAATIKIVNPINGERLGQSDLFSIKWQMTFTDNVKIEFTSDGGSNWSVLTPSAGGGILDWLVPEITSENCKFRMTAISDKQIVGESGIFAIGKQTGKITLPKPGDVFCVGEFNEIKWNSDYVTFMFLDYSTDGGNIWKRVTPKPIDGSLGGYSWKTPSYLSQNALIRISAKINQNYVVLDNMTAPFKIDSCVLSIENNNLNEQRVIISEIKPNPAKEYLGLNISNFLVENISFSIQLIDEKGSLIKEIINGYLPLGNSDYHIKLNNISQGNYFLLLKTFDREAVYPIKIIN